MERRSSAGSSIMAWGGVWAFWLVTTRKMHPTFGLAVIVTTSLVAAFAVADAVNRKMLMPRYWRTGRRVRYAASLFGAMAFLTAVALGLIRVSYFSLHGPDADPNGFYKHFAIDLFGMAVHVGAAALVVRWHARCRKLVDPDIREGGR